jgi:pimeloyl-ACP methyl ester carboxylesterase
MDNHQEISHWAIGGHSLGGAMAASFTAGQPDTIDALVLWAAYPAENNDLSAMSSLPVSSIFASNDGVATIADIDASRPLLPAETGWVEIAGGNHAQFGWYGPQPGDGAATISRQDQQDQVFAGTIQLLHQISGSGR